jgi:hypothetical protein
MPDFNSLRILLVEDEIHALDSAIEWLLEFGHAEHSIIPVHVNPAGTSANASRVSDRCRIRPTPPGLTSVDEVGAHLGHVLRSHHCRIVILDLQLAGLTPDPALAEYRNMLEQFVAEGRNVARPLQEGAVIARQMFRQFGVRYMIWLTQWAEELGRNVTPQVVSQVSGSEIAVIECPRTYLCKKDRSSLKAALDCIRNDIIGLLNSSEIEWEVPCSRLRELQRRLMRDGSVSHGLKRRSKEELDAISDLDVIPNYHPPCPFGMWIHAVNRGERHPYEMLYDEPVDGPRREELADQVDRWARRHLWGLPLAEIKSDKGLFTRALNGAYLSREENGIEVYAVGDDGGAVITPCAREALLSILGNMLRNAHENRLVSTPITLSAGLLQEERRELVAFAVTNQVKDPRSLLEAIRQREMTPQGLGTIQDAVECMNTLQGAQDAWSFQFGVWEEGKWLLDKWSGYSKICAVAPWRVGQPPATVCEGKLSGVPGVPPSTTAVTAILCGPIDRTTI